MSDDIVTRLREEVAKAEVAGVLPHWELARCMWEAAAEIERLREQVEDCENDFHALKQIFDKVRAERDHES